MLATAKRSSVPSVIGCCMPTAVCQGVGNTSMMRMVPSGIRIAWRSSSHETCQAQTKIVAVAAGSRTRGSSPFRKRAPKIVASARPVTTKGQLLTTCGSLLGHLLHLGQPVEGHVHGLEIGREARVAVLLEGDLLR